MPNGHAGDTTVRQLSEFVTYPRESLEIELKAWLDPTSNDDRARIAKELIALANHGGGYLIIGFEEVGGDWVPSTPRPNNLNAFNQDAINGIVARYADPEFHCDVHHVTPQGEDVAYPVIVVAGGKTVPVRASRDGPNQRFISQNTYYVRRPGPNSEPPQSGREWDQLLHRCLTNRRENLLDDIRHILEGKAGERKSRPGSEERLSEWITASFERWEDVVDERLDPEDSRFEPGWWAVGYVLDPPADFESANDLLDALRDAEGRETGWPPWWAPRRDGIRPYPHHGSVECWLGENRFGDGAHSDFWRASRLGELFLLRGYQEDGVQPEFDPGQYIDLVLPVWRVGECVLHAQSFAEAVFEETSDVNVLMRFRWTGLADRELTSWANRNRILVHSYTARQDEVQSEASFLAGEVVGQLPEIVRAITQPLYEAFDMFDPPADMAESELDRLRSR